MSFSWSTTPRPIVALAPMAGITDASYRQLIKRVAPRTIVYTEFLSSDAISYGAGRTLEMLEFDASIERPLVVQIFGASPVRFLEACRVIEQVGADGIDINMGCPAARIVSSCYGSALIRRPDLAAELVYAAVNAVNIPVSVKTRLGWDTHETLIPFCKKLEEAGAAAFAIHGRLYNDKFSGAANWEPIYELKKELKVPIIGNGDIASAADALEKIGNLDGVMVGRGTFGNPWLMLEIAQAFQLRMENRGQAMENERLYRPLSFVEKIPMIIEHLDLSVRMKGERRGVLEMRRHLSSYVKGFDGARELRMKILAMERLDEVKEALRR